MSASDAQLLKQYETQRLKRRGNLEALEFQAEQLRKDIKAEKDAIASLDGHIKKLKEKNKDIIVTEHAMLRYLERVKGVDLASLQSEMVTEKVKSMVSALGGNGLYPSDHCKLRIKNFAVVTILPLKGDS